jgi:alpha-2-macroglobulin-like protein
VPATAVAGTVRATVRLYPSPVATMLAAVDALIAEPSGCFEQASSSNYPNVMVARYLAATGGDEPAIAARVDRALDTGYQLLTGYESPDRGYEWFGGNPGHEALTAYGLLEFREMAKVYRGVDAKMVERTAAWLKTRRDGNGGYQRNARALDSFGSASQEVTDAYITYALARAGEAGLDAELARAAGAARTSSDPYVLALSTGGVLAADAASAAGKAGLRRLAAMQATDGRFAGADHSITRSGGIALDIETTALAALALMHDRAAYRTHIDAAAAWLGAQRGALGGFSSTQATILALDALTAHAAMPAAPAGTKVTLWVNGEEVAAVALDDADGAIDLPDVGAHLRAGDNTIELRAPGAAQVPYSLGVRWSEAAPSSSPDATVGVTTRLAKTRLRVGRGVRLTAKIENRTDAGQPMTIARIGIPGGLRYQPWQLDELVARGHADFVETREREVIVYLRQLAPGETRTVPIELLAQVPGRYVGPPSAAYLYYTDEHRHYAPPVAVTITRPVAARTKRRK